MGKKKSRTDLDADNEDTRRDTPDQESSDSADEVPVATRQSGGACSRFCAVVFGLLKVAVIITVLVGLLSIIVALVSI